MKAKSEPKKCLLIDEAVSEIEFEIMTCKMHICQYDLDMKDTKSEEHRKEISRRIAYCYAQIDAYKHLYDRIQFLLKIRGEDL